jgi:hypothetical protein
MPPFSLPGKTRSFQPNAQDQPALSQPHLLFIRWLVQQGKLTEGPP